MMTSKMERKEYQLVDICKLFFAMCIVALHTGVCGDVNSFAQWQVTNLVFRLAVPYFFIASGFFLSRKILLAQTNDEKKKIIIGYTKHMIPPFILWGSIGLLLQMLMDFYHGKSALYIAANITRHALFYPLNAMWFCLACIVAAWLLFFFESHNKMLLGSILAGGGYIFIGVLANSYYYLFDGSCVGAVIRLCLKCFVSTRNGFSVAFLFFMQSYFIAHRIGIKGTHSGFVWLFFLLSYMCLILEETHLFPRVVVVDDHSMFLSFIVLIPAMFYLTVCYDGALNQDASYMIRKLSTGIFFLHATIRTVIVKLGVHILHIPIPEQTVFPVVLLLSVCATVIVYKNDNRITRHLRVFIGG